MATGTPGNDPNLVGTTGANSIDGLAGNDTINPLTRSAASPGHYDVVIGGADFDTLKIDASAETRAIFGQVFFGGSYQVTSNSGNFWAVTDTTIERVDVTGGRGNDLLQGLVFDDVLRGGEGDDYFDGGYGFDILDGGDGVDTVDQRFYNGNVYVDLTLGRTNFDGTGLYDTLIDIENFLAGGGNDRLTGNGLVNVLAGGAGIDTLNGLDGDDKLYGQDGDDRLNGGNQDDELHGENNDDELLGGAGVDKLYGGNGEDDLSGGPNNDLLDGGYGLDTLNGGGGVDYADYQFYNGATTVNLATGRTTFSGQAGFETLISIENVLMGNGKDILIGNGLDNLLAGGGGSDKLNGGNGHDRLFGDAYYSFAKGPPGGDTLDGGNGDDQLHGDEGRDTLIGGLGSDYLDGGHDADLFDFNKLQDSIVGISRDEIRGFGRNEGDRIDLSTIDANYHRAGNQSFNFIGATGFTGKEGQLHFVRKNGYVNVEGDVDGNGKADFQIQVDNIGGLDRADFVL